MRKYFEFLSETKIKCGESALSTINEELRYWGCSHPILLTSQNVTKLGVTAKVQAALNADTVTGCLLYDNVPAKADADIVRAIKKSYLSEKCDGIIALGGDGVMDTAKCLKLFLTQGCDEILPIAGENAEKSKEVPLIAIPTENGSGKEANGYLETEGRYVTSRTLCPNAVIIDEDTAMAAPARTIAACGVHALTNAIEAFLHCDDLDPAGIYAETAIKALYENLGSAVKDGDNEAACRATAVAATYAGIAYGNYPFGAAHALAEGLSEISGEPVEEMLCTTLVPAMKAAKETHADKLRTILSHITSADEHAEIPESERAEKAISKIEELLESLREIANIPTKIRQTKIAREDFGRIAEASASTRESITATNVLDTSAFIDLLNEAY